MDGLIRLTPRYSGQGLYVPGLDELVEKALKILDNAYAPYSGVKVAAALETGDGSVFLGVNVENASYGLTICAERAAVAAAVAAGKRRFKRIVIVSNLEEPIPPCGACRQVLAEFAEDMEIVSVSAKTGKRRVWRLRELLPEAFTSRHLARNV